MPSTVRVIHVLGSLERGGAETRLLEVGEALRDSGLEAEQWFVLLSGRPGVLATRAEAFGARVVPLRLSLAFPFRFVALLRRLNPRVVHSHVHAFTGWILFLAWLARTPRRIAHFRSTGDGRPPSSRRRLQNWAGRRLILGSATDILAGTDAVMDTVWHGRWRRDPRFKVVPQGVPVGQYIRAVELDRWGPRDPTALQLGRIDEDKNQMATLRAWSIVKRERPDARLRVVGRASEPYASLVRETIAALGLASCVDLIAETDAVPALLASVDLLVHPTRREGWPGVIAEARAAGLPVVASSIAPIVEFSSRLTGIKMVDVENEIEFGEAILKALDGRATRSQRVRDGAALLQSEFDVQGSALALYHIWSR